jgi:NADH-quinone oxidoreductase subunit J
MTLQAIAFYVLAATAVLSALLVVSARNPVRSVLWLIATFFSAAGLFVLVGAEFLAMLLVVVYVGAVMVLFLFVVMMLDVDFVELKQGFLSYLPVGGLIALGLLAELVLVGVSTWGTGEPVTPTRFGAEDLGAVLYKDYLLVFQTAGMVLLLAMIGAIVLTLRHREGVKRQDIGAQVARRRKDAVTLVDIKPGQGL